jgi:hypothetical protein
VPREVAEVEIALGRLRIVRERFRIIRNHETFLEGAGTRSLQLSIDEGRPALRVSYSEPTEKWSLQLDETVGALWTREYRSDEGQMIKVNYVQRPHQPIAIEINGLGPEPLRMSGASLWHLTQQSPPGFTSCVLPSLERLNPTWDLCGTLATAERIADTAGIHADSSDAPSILQSVADLESSDQSDRAAALNRLRQAGLAAHIPLEQLARKPLTTQQRESVERLLRVLEPPSADTPTRLAYWLSGDPAWR